MSDVFDLHVKISPFLPRSKQTFEYCRSCAETVLLWWRYQGYQARLLSLLRLKWRFRWILLNSTVDSRIYRKIACSTVFSRLVKVIFSSEKNACFSQNLRCSKQSTPPLHFAVNCHRPRVYFLYFFNYCGNLVEGGVMWVLISRLQLYAKEIGERAG